ncbi:MAG: hypothetical protein CMH57_11305 [Myxococcales bacterium]|nr:hypothetical protein [Myxococcales bacterium]
MSIDEGSVEAGWGEEALIATRRHLHRNPELSGAEHETARYVAERLGELGLEAELGAHGAPTGVVAVIEGAHPGPTLAWRADTDALPIHEESGAEYASCRPGVMHACGHDVHTTIGLGIASRLVASRERLRGRVKMIFQPEEEGVPGDRVAGAEAMAQAGVLDSPKVDAIFAAHCMPSIPVGRIGYRHTAMWAGSDHWRLVIRGRQSHGAYPQDGVDPIWIAGQIIVALQGIPARVIDSRRCCVLSVGKVEAGEAFNVIPETVTLVGLLRTLEDDVRERAVAALRQTVDGICQAWGARAELNISRGAEVTANDPALVERALATLRGQVGAERLAEVEPQMGAEDFASFSRRRPAAYFLLGVGNEARGIVHPIHSPRFDVDERCLPFAVQAFSGMLLDLAEDWPGA